MIRVLRVDGVEWRVSAGEPRLDREQRTAESGESGVESAAKRIFESRECAKNVLWRAFGDLRAEKCRSAIEQ